MPNSADDAGPPAETCKVCGGKVKSLCECCYRNDYDTPQVDEMCEDCAKAENYIECVGCGAWYLEDDMSYELDDDTPYCKTCVEEANP